MKISNKIVYLLIAIIPMSCGEDFLDLQPESAADIEDIYKTPEDFNQAVIGAYDELQSSGQYGGSFQVMMETRGDVVQEVSAAFRDGIYYEVDRFLLRPSNPIIKSAWASLYKGIFRCNLIIERLQDVDLGSNFESQIEAESKFIRALSYFNAVRFWGNVPLVLKSISPDEALEIGRTDVSEVFAIIEADLIYAAEYLQSSYSDVDGGRATRDAARTLLAKVYLNQKKYEDAELILSELVSGPYALLANIEDVFESRNEINEEILFSVRWKKVVEETDLFFGRATNGIAISDDFLNRFEINDPRRTLLELELVGSYSVPSKYADPAGTDGKTGRDFPILRFSDVLLMYAEVLNEISYSPGGEAFNVLNQVRSRVNLAPLTSTDLRNQVSFREQILFERSLELALEGHRWFDLVRTDQAISVLGNEGISIAPFQYVYPIPQNEIDRINNLNFHQNEGYN